MIILEDKVNKALAEILVVADKGDLIVKVVPDKSITTDPPPGKKLDSVIVKVYDAKVFMAKVEAVIAIEVKSEAAGMIPTYPKA